MPKIKRIGDRCLRLTSEEVVFDKNEIHKLFTDMCEAMYEEDGIGLAAPQIGINKRVIIVDETTEEHGRYTHLMVNPKNGEYVLVSIRLRQKNQTLHYVRLQECD